MKTTTELKAEAYDILAQIEAHQFRIQELQKSLMDKNKEIEESLMVMKTATPEEKAALGISDGQAN